MTGITCAVAGSGSYIASTTVTVGTRSSGGTTFYGYDAIMGSVNPSNWNGLIIVDINWNSTNELLFRVEGKVPDAGWQTMTIGSTVYNRVDAAYYYSAPNTLWIWSGVSNPFGTSVGATRKVTWI